MEESIEITEAEEVTIKQEGSTAGSSWCFLCGKRVGASARSSTHIFQATTSNSQQPVASRIAATLQMEIKPEVVPSQVVCKGCHKAVSSIDELESQLSELREQLISQHRRTSRLLQAGELSPADAAPTQSAASGSGEEKHSRKTKLTPRVELPEEGVATPKKVKVVAHPTPQKRGKGRPAKKKPSVETVENVESVENVEIDAEHDELLKSLELLHNDEVPVVVQEKETVFVVENRELSEEEDTGAAGLDSDDPEFEPLEDPLEEDSDDPEFVPKKKESARLKRQTVSFVEKKKQLKGLPKKRGRPRMPLEVKLETYSDGEAVGADDDAEPVDEADIDDPEAVFSCSACESRFTVASALIAHLRRRHGITVVMCDLCGIDFDHKSQLVEHMASAHPPDEPEEVPEEAHEYDPELDAEGDFQCEICNRLFYSLRLLRDHKRVHYGRNFSCEVCHKRFSSKNLLEEHQNIHTGQRPYQCSTCGKTFTSKYCLKVHTKIHQVRPRPFACDTCTKTFMKPEHLVQHLKTHQAEKEFVCTTCNKGFSSARNLEVHMVVHTGYKPFVCRTCGKAFARRAEILDHERTHTGERPFQCETCGATFSQRSNLQSHKRATHMDDRRFTCQQCGKSFKRRRLLDYHTRSVHTGERPYACTECSATFVYPEHFKKHRRIHTGEKPYRCEVCGKAFNSRDNRNAHRFIHSNKKPYECLVCGLGFMRKPLLYSHMQTQGHVHDTIVVNQPQVPQSASNVVSEAAAAAGISSEKVYVSTADDPEPQLVEEVDHIVIEGPVHFDEGDEGHSDRTHAILVPVSSGEDGGKGVQLVQIRLQGAAGEEPQWINLSTS